MPYFEAWRRFCDFTGKTDRSQYWAALFTHFFVYTFLMLALTVGLVIWSGLSDESISVATKVALAIYNLAFLVPCIAMTVRRLRDAGYSAKSFFWLLVPVVGGIAFFARLCTKRSEEENSV